MIASQRIFQCVPGRRGALDSGRKLAHSGEGGDLSRLHQIDDRILGLSQQLIDLLGFGVGLLGVKPASKVVMIEAEAREMAQPSPMKLASEIFPSASRTKTVTLSPQIGL